MEHAKTTHITSIGWGSILIEGMLDRVQERCNNIRFTHIVLTSADVLELERNGSRNDATPIRISLKEPLPEPDLALLASLETDDVPTIHNMILGDRIVRKLPRKLALSYATLLANRMRTILEKHRPDIVIGGFDSIHGAMGLAVCRSLGIPWVAMAFTVLPSGLMGFCNKISPNGLLPILREIDDALMVETNSAYESFVSRARATPCYNGIRPISTILWRIPVNIKNLVAELLRKFAGSTSNYNCHGLLNKLQMWFLNNYNYIMFRHSFYLRTPPTDRFALFTLHMQPESSIDAWAPFFSDQLQLINVIARAMPPDLRLLVKLHRSDPHPHTPRPSRALMSLPGVTLVHPTANARDFIERAELVFGIQGTACLEAALIGKPVLMFGDSPYLQFPSVQSVKTFTDLPTQIRYMVSKPAPSKNEILKAYAGYLSQFMPAVFNDWTKPISEESICAISKCFQKLIAMSRG